MSAPDDMPLFSILEAQGESSIVEMYESDLRLAREENARLRKENAMLRFKLFGSQSEKLGKLTKTLIEEPEGTGTTKTRKLVAPNNITRHYSYYAPARPAAQGTPSQVCSGLGVWLLKPHPAPYGLVTTTGCTTQSPRGLGGGLDKLEGFAPQGRAANGVAASQPIQWSSEYADTDLGLVYYNYRHYNPLDGRWTGRDPIGISGGYNLCTFSNNSPAHNIDNQGLNICCDQCKDLGVTEATIRLKITSQYGDPDIVDGVNLFSKVFDYGANGAKRIFKPLSIASDLYTESVNSVSSFFANRSQARKDGLWVVHGRMEYSVCSVESCLLIFKRKTLSKKDTGWVSSAAILPNDYADAVREVEKKLKKMLKNIN